MSVTYPDPVAADVVSDLRIGPVGTLRAGARFPQGESVPVVATFRTAAGVLTDPAGVTVEVLGPDLAPVTALLGRDAVGTWRAQVPTPLAGLYRVWMRCTGPTPSVGYGEFTAAGVGAIEPDELAAATADLLSRAGQAGAAAGSAAASGLLDAAYTPIVVPGTSRTVTASDRGRELAFTAATPVAVTLPNDLPAGFRVLLRWLGVGRPGVVAASGATISDATPFRFVLAVDFAILATVLTNTTGANARWLIEGSGTDV